MKIKVLHIILTFILINLAMKAPLRLPAIYFHQNSTEFIKKPDLKGEKSSKKALRHIINLMKSRPEISKLEISGYCDFTETDSTLGMQRARKLLGYMISSGLDSNRFSLKGFHDTRYLVSQEEIDKVESKLEIEKLHLLNRRVEFQVIYTEKKSK